MKQTLVMVLCLNSLKNILSKQNNHIDIEEVRANVRKEDRIIDALEPVLNPAPS